MTRAAGQPPPAPSSPVRVRTAGVALLAALAVTCLVPLFHRGDRAGYLDVGLAAVCLGAGATAGRLAVAGGPGEWRAAAAVAAVLVAGYAIARGVGWPGASTDVGRWSSPDGTAALAAGTAVLVVSSWALRDLGTRRRPVAARRRPVTEPVPGAGRPA